MATDENTQRQIDNANEALVHGKWLMVGEDEIVPGFLDMGVPLTYNQWVIKWDALMRMGDYDELPRNVRDEYKGPPIERRRERPARQGL